MKKLLSLALTMCLIVSVFSAIAVNANASGKMYQVKPYYTVDAFEIIGSDSHSESTDVSDKTVYVDSECTLKAAEQVDISIYALADGTTLQKFEEDIWDEANLKFTMSPTYVLSTYPGSKMPTSIALQKGTYAVEVTKGGNGVYTLVVVGGASAEIPAVPQSNSNFEYLILRKEMTGVSTIPKMEKDTIIITDVLDLGTETITVPESIDGYDVSGVDYRFLSNTDAVNVYLPSTFRFMWKVKKHSQDERYVGNIVHVDYFETDGIENIHVDANNPYHTSVDGVLFSKDMSVLEIYPKGRNEKTYTVPEGVKELAYESFEDSENLEKIVLPKTLKIIGPGAFSGCENLSECVIPEGVETIEESAFHMCESLKSINVPRSVKKLRCSNYSGNKYYLGYNAPTVIYYAGSQAEFRQIKNRVDDTLSEVDLSKLTIYYAEEGNTVPSQSTKEDSIDNYVHVPVAQYWNINNDVLGVISKDFLEIRLTYGEIEKVDSSSGVYCYSFKNWPVTVSCVSGFSADGHYSENGKVLPNPLDACIRAYCTIGDLISGLENRAYTAAELSAHTGLEFTETNGRISASINGVLIDITAQNTVKSSDNVTLIAEWSIPNRPIYAISKVDLSECTQKGIYYYHHDILVKIHESASGKIVIPNAIDGQKITKIGHKALLNNKNVTEVVIEDGIEQIGEYAFYNMPELTKVKMPKSLRKIEENAFGECKKLVRANVPTGVEVIGSGAFKGCSSLQFARIPNSVYETGHDLFKNCNSLTTVAWLNNFSSNTFVGFDGPIKNAVLGRNINMIPLAHFTPGATVENLLLTSTKILGTSGGNYGSGLLSPEEIWYTGDEETIYECIDKGNLRWEEENVVGKCNPYEFPSLPEFIKDYEVVSVVLNGKVLFPDVKPYIKNDRVLVPMRVIFEAMGMSVEWNDSTKTVTAKGNGNTVELQIGNKVATINGEKVEMDVPAEINGDRTMVPLRFVSENVGAYVQWDGTDKVVYIYYGPSTELHKYSLDVLNKRLYADTYCDLIKELDANGQVNLDNNRKKLLLIAEDPFKYFTRNESKALKATLTDALLSDEAMEYLETQALCNYCYTMTQHLKNATEIYGLNGKVLDVTLKTKLDILENRYENILELKDFASIKAEAQKDSTFLSETNEEIIGMLEDDEIILLGQKNAYKNYTRTAKAVNTALDIAEIGAAGIEKAAMVNALQNSYDLYYKNLLLFAEGIENEDVKEAVLDIADTMKSEADSVIANCIEEMGKEAAIKFLPKIIEVCGKGVIKAVAAKLDVVGTVVDLSLLCVETYDASLTKIHSQADLLLFSEIKAELMEQFDKFYDLAENGQTYVYCSKKTAAAFGEEQTKIKTTDAILAISNILVPVNMHMCEQFKTLGNAENNTIYSAIVDLFDDGAVTLYDPSFDRIYNDEMEMLKNVQLLY